MNTAVACVLAVVAAALLALAFPAFDQGWLAWVALAPLLVALRRVSAKGAAGIAWLFGCVFVASSFFWATQISAISLSAFMLMVVVFAVYFAAFGGLYWLMERALGSGMILAAPALWVALEYIRSNVGFLAFPWALLGHSQYQYRLLIQIADFAGVYGVSFLIVMANQLGSELVDRLWRAWRAPSDSPVSDSRAWLARFVQVAACLVLASGYGWYRLSAAEPTERLRVALVQANLIARDGMSYSDQLEHMLTYEKLSREAASQDPALILWPSSSLPAEVAGNRVVQYVLRRVTNETGAHLLVGGAGGEKLAPPRPGHLPYSNSEFLLSPEGRLVARHDKILLLPFNEYVPLQDVVKWPRWITTLESSFRRGERRTLFPVGNARFGVTICWENMFSDYVRAFVRDGAHFMVSATNEGFYGRTAAPYQTLAMNVFRAVENRITVIRVATTGVSAFIDGNGTIVERVRDERGDDLFVRGVLVRDVPLARGRTLYTLYGDVFAVVVTLVAVGLIIGTILPLRVAARRSRVVTAG